MESVAVVKTVTVDLNPLSQELIAKIQGTQSQVSSDHADSLSVSEGTEEDQDGEQNKETRAETSGQVCVQVDVDDKKTEQVEVEHADQPALKRGRGRPRKIAMATESDGEKKAEKSVLETEIGNDRSKTPEQASVETKRGRGRPSKSSSPPDNEKRTDHADPIGEKTEKDGNEQTAFDSGRETNRSKQVTPGAKSVKRGRGRPSKRSIETATDPSKSEQNGMESDDENNTEKDRPAFATQIMGIIDRLEEISTDAEAEADEPEQTPVHTEKEEKKQEDNVLQNEGCGNIPDQSDVVKEGETSVLSSQEEIDVEKENGISEEKEIRKEENTDKGEEKDINTTVTEKPGTRDQPETFPVSVEVHRESESPEQVAVVTKRGRGRPKKTATDKPETVVDTNDSNEKQLEEGHVESEVKNSGNEQKSVLSEELNSSSQNTVENESEQNRQGQSSTETDKHDKVEAEPEKTSDESGSQVDRTDQSEQSAVETEGKKEGSCGISTKDKRESSRTEQKSNESDQRNNLLEQIGLFCETERDRPHQTSVSTEKGKRSPEPKLVKGQTEYIVRSEQISQKGDHGDRELERKEAINVNESCRSEKIDSEKDLVTSREKETVAGRSGQVDEQTETNGSNLEHVRVDIGEEKDGSNLSDGREGQLEPSGGECEKDSIRLGEAVPQTKALTDTPVQISPGNDGELGKSKQVAMVTKKGRGRPKKRSMAPAREIEKSGQISDSSKSKMNKEGGVSEEIEEKKDELSSTEHGKHGKHVCETDGQEQNGVEKERKGDKAKQKGFQTERERSVGEVNAITMKRVTVSIVRLRQADLAVTSGVDSGRQKGQSEQSRTESAMDQSIRETIADEEKSVKSDKTDSRKEGITSVSETEESAAEQTPVVRKVGRPKKSFKKKRGMPKRVPVTITDVTDTTELSAEQRGQRKREAPWVVVIAAKRMRGRPKKVAKATGWGRGRPRKVALAVRKESGRTEHIVNEPQREGPSVFKRGSGRPKRVSISSTRETTVRVVEDMSNVNHIENVTADLTEVDEIHTKKSQNSNGSKIRPQSDKCENETLVKRTRGKPRKVPMAQPGHPGEETGSEKKIKEKDSARNDEAVDIHNVQYNARVYVERLKDPVKYRHLLNDHEVSGHKHSVGRDGSQGPVKTKTQDQVTPKTKDISNLNYNVHVCIERMKDPERYGQLSSGSKVEGSESVNAPLSPGKRKRGRPKKHVRNSPASVRLADDTNDSGQDNLDVKDVPEVSTVVKRRKVSMHITLEKDDHTRWQQLQDQLQMDSSELLHHLLDTHSSSCKTCDDRVKDV